MPLFCFWIFGSVNLFVGYLLRPQQCGSQQVAASMKKGHRTSYLPESIDGLGTFLFSYCVPSALLMISVFYEFANRDLWLNVPQPSSEPVSAVKAPMSPFMVRAFMELLLGVIASAWALGPRAINFWKSKTPPGNKNVAQMQMMKPMQTYSNVPGSVAGSSMVQYQLAQPLMQPQMQQQGHPHLHHLQHQQQMMGGMMSSGGGGSGGSHFGVNKFIPSSYPAVSYQTVCQAPSSYLSATGSIPRQYHRKYHAQQQPLMGQHVVPQQQQQMQQHNSHHHQGGGRKMRNSNYKMTMSQSISLTGNETIL